MKFCPKPKVTLLSPKYFLGLVNYSTKTTGYKLPLEVSSEENFERVTQYSVYLFYIECHLKMLS